MTPVIFHIDVDSAYLSWTAVEQLKNGAKIDLREIPAVIGGDQKSRHGVVLAKSIPGKDTASAQGNLLRMPFGECSESGHGVSGSQVVPGKESGADGVIFGI